MHKNARPSWVGRLNDPRVRLPVLVVLAYALPVLLFMNQKDNITSLFLNQAAVVTVVCVLFGLVVWAVARLILRSWTRAAVFAVVFSFLSLQYKAWFDITKGLLRRFGDPSTVSYLVFALATIGLLVLAWRLRFAAIRKVAGYFLALVIVMTVLYGIHLAYYLITNSGVKVSVDNRDLATAPVHAKAKPDIYYIILEDYTGPRGLREGYHFDNSAFDNQLRQRGFYVAEDSHSNYPSTTPSVASSLNGGLLKVSGPVSRTTEGRVLYPLYAKPAVAEYLKRAGYSYTLVGSWWANTSTSSIADDNPRFGWSVDLFGRTYNFHYFTGVFVSGTVFGDFYDRRFPSAFAPGFSNGDIFHAQIAEVKRQPQEGPHPKFVFSQLMMPHTPYQFAPDGSPVNPALSSDERYLEQLQYTSRQAIQMVDAIKAGYPKDNQPIIVISSDEGEYPDGEHPGEHDISVNAPDATLQQKTSIPSAYYLPNQQYGSFYQTISPVNMFRVIFNDYFGAGLKLQPDLVTTFATSADHPLDFADITGRIIPTTPTHPG